MAEASTAVAKTNPVTELQNGVAKRIDQIGLSLPGHITKDKFLRTAQTAIAMTRNIEKAKPGSLLQAVSKAAADGLILDGREAALVVDYQGEVQYRPMMRGLLKLAYQSGRLKSIVVETARTEDVFIYSPTNADEPIRHEINLKAPRGDVYAVYAKAELIDGGLVFEVMTTEDVNSIRDRSDAYRAFKNGKIKSTPWSTDWSEMARKTVFRRLSKYLPSSTDRDLLHQAAERIDDDYSFEAEQDDAPPPVPAGKKRGGAAAALKTVEPAQQPSEDVHDIDPETGEVIEAGTDDQFPGDIDSPEQRAEDDI